jgi:hypothetical protein
MALTLRLLSVNSYQLYQREGEQGRKSIALRWVDWGCARLRHDKLHRDFAETGTLKEDYLYRQSGLRKCADLAKFCDSAKTQKVKNFVKKC